MLILNCMKKLRQEINSAIKNSWGKETKGHCSSRKVAPKRDRPCNQSSDGGTWHDRERKFSQAVVYILMWFHSRWDWITLCIQRWRLCHQRNGLFAELTDFSLSRPVLLTALPPPSPPLCEKCHEKIGFVYLLFVAFLVDLTWKTKSFFFFFVRLKKQLTRKLFENTELLQQPRKKEQSTW